MHNWPIANSATDFLGVSRRCIFTDYDSRIVSVFAVETPDIPQYDIGDMFAYGFTDTRKRIKRISVSSTREQALASAFAEAYELGFVPVLPN